MPSRVSVIGLGNIGSALACALVAEGHEVRRAGREMQAAGVRGQVLDAMVAVLADARKRGRGQDEFGTAVYEFPRGHRLTKHN